MQLINKNLKATLLRAAVLGVAVLSGHNVAAQPTGVDASGRDTRAHADGSRQHQGWGAQLGYNSDYRRAALVYETPSLWTHRFSSGWGRVDLDLELGVSYWDAKHGDPQSMWQASAIPILRWWPTDAFFMEAGVGPTVLSRSEFAGRGLGTRFQFGSYLGAGVLISDNHRIGIRYSHFSNASIKKPNDGLDIYQLTYTYQF